MTWLLHIRVCRYRSLFAGILTCLLAIKAVWLLAPKPQRLKTYERSRNYDGSCTPSASFGVPLYVQKTFPRYPKTIMVNLYTVLGVRERATDDEIDAAWRNITRKPNSAAGEGTQDEPPGSKCNLYTILGVRQDATHAEFSNTYRDITQPPDGVIDERTRDGKLVRRCIL